MIRMIADQGNNHNERRWQIQSEQINQSLIQSGIDDYSIRGVAGMGSFLYKIRDHMNAGASSLRAAVSDIAQSLKIDGIRANIRGSEIHLLIPQSEDVAVPLLDLAARHGEIPKSSALLGLSENGSTVLHDFASKDTPHLLIVGGRNAGKTVMMRSIAASLAINNRQGEIQLAAISPILAEEARQRLQSTTWFPLNYLPHMLCDVALKHTDIVEVLSFLVQEAFYREKHSFSIPRIVLLIDQADILLQRGGRQCAEPITKLAQVGEDVGIHLVLGAESIDSTTLGTQLMQAMSTRLIGRLEPEESDLPGLVDDGAEQLLGEGDFLHRVGNQIQRLQGAYIDDYDLHLRLTRLYQKRAILLARPAESRLRLSQSQPSQIKIPAAPRQDELVEPMAAAVT